jgi:hypothetical protein
VGGQRRAKDPQDPGLLGGAARGRAALRYDGTNFRRRYLQGFPILTQKVSSFEYLHKLLMVANENKLTEMQNILQGNWTSE